ncbi:Hypothetical predicted protein [Pelobates cultripes]|uniref:Reverse transcriptase domain-containing protein n=1 Tax=Pelobates cultripes TaxID=61616 RepID=A0AAD1R7H8_PELCU|nr:Hypothetical predicted protein [Pelobates cultripes]
MTKAAEIQQYLTFETYHDLETLDAPISEEELAYAIKTSQNGKLPGLDGLPLSYYKTFCVELLPKLLKALNSILEDAKSSRQFTSDNITLLPKRQKKPPFASATEPTSGAKHLRLGPQASFQGSTWSPLPPTWLF